MQEVISSSNATTLFSIREYARKLSLTDDQPRSRVFLLKSHQDLETIRQATDEEIKDWAQAPISLFDFSLTFNSILSDPDRAPSGSELFSYPDRYDTTEVVAITSVSNCLARCASTAPGKCSLLLGVPLELVKFAAITPPHTVTCVLLSTGIKITPKNLFKQVLVGGDVVSMTQALGASI